MFYPLPPNLMFQSALLICQTLQSAGYEAVFAGGCVRDELMGIEPKDYDIATSATPQQVLALFPNGDEIGAHFGVILIKKDGHHFEVATFRVDGNYQDGRRPDSVTFASAEEDAKRRDFTINGIFKDPVSGELKDYVNGRKDLEDKILRAIGNPKKRFEEDALRLLRAIRFSTKTSFPIEPQTWSAVKESAPLLSQISIERIRDEFNQIITHPKRAEGIELLVQSGLMEVFLPEFLDLIGCDQPEEWHPEGDVYTHTKIALSLLEPDSPLELCLAVLLHDIAKPPTRTYDEEAERIRFNGHDMLGAEMAETILTRMRYSNATISAVKEMVAYHMRFMDVQKMRTAKLKRFMARETFPLEMELHRVDCASSNGFTENYDFLNEKGQEFANEPIIPPPLVSGKDLIHLGFSSSPLFKKILSDVETEQLEQRITTKEEALTFIKKKYVTAS